MITFAYLDEYYSLNKNKNLDINTFIDYKTEQNIGLYLINFIVLLFIITYNFKFYNKTNNSSNNQIGGNVLSSQNVSSLQNVLSSQNVSSLQNIIPTQPDYKKEEDKKEDKKEEDKKKEDKKEDKKEEDKKEDKKEEDKKKEDKKEKDKRKRNKKSFIEYTFSKILDPNFFIKILIISFVSFLILGWLSLKKIKLLCYGCDAGSWWYTCLPDTGKGSKFCDVQKDIDKKFGRVMYSVENVQMLVQELLKKILELPPKLVNMLTSGIQKFTRIFTKLIIIAKIPIPKLDCSINIPEPIGESLNVCDLANKPIEGMIKLVQSGLIDKLIDIFKAMFKGIKQIFSKIAVEMSKLFTNVLDELGLSFITDLINNLFKEFERLLSALKNIGFINVAYLWIVNILKQILPFDITILFMIAAIIFFSVFIVPIIGSLFILYSIVISLFGAFLGPIGILTSIKNAI